MGRNRRLVFGGLASQSCSLLLSPSKLISARISSLWDEDQEAVGADGVHNGIGHTARVCQGVFVLEVETLEQLCGQLLGALRCLRAHGQEVRRQGLLLKSMIIL